MPTYEVTDSQTGRKFHLTGDSPPTEEEIHQAIGPLLNQKDLSRPDQTATNQNPENRIVGKGTSTSPSEVPTLGSRISGGLKTMFPAVSGALDVYGAIPDDMKPFHGAGAAAAEGFKSGKGLTAAALNLPPGANTYGLDLPVQGLLAGTAALGTALPPVNKVLNAADTGYKIGQDVMYKTGTGDKILPRDLDKYLATAEGRQGGLEPTQGLPSESTTRNFGSELGQVAQKQPISLPVALVGAAAGLEGIGKGGPLKTTTAPIEEVSPRVKQLVTSAAKPANKLGRIVTDFNGDETTKWDRSLTTAMPEIAKTGLEFKKGPQAFEDLGVAAKQVKDNAYSEITKIIGQNDIPAETSPVADRLQKIYDRVSKSSLHDPEELQALQSEIDKYKGASYPLSVIESDIVELNRQNNPFFEATQQGQKTKLGRLGQEVKLEIGRGLSESEQTALDNIPNQGALGTKVKQLKQLYGAASDIYKSVQSRILPEARQQLLSLQEKQSYAGAAGDAVLALGLKGISPKAALGMAGRAVAKAALAKYMKFQDSAGVKVSNAMRQLRSGKSQSNFGSIPPVAPLMISRPQDQQSP